MYSLTSAPSLLPLPRGGESLRYCCFNRDAFCCSKSQRCTRHPARSLLICCSTSSLPWCYAHLTAQSDGGVGEGLPLSFKSLPLMAELCPVQLEALPLLQKVGIGQFGRDRWSKTVLSDPTVQLMLRKAHIWKRCMAGSSRTCRSCCCNLTSCWLSLRSDSNLARSLRCSGPTPVWPASSQTDLCDSPSHRAKTFLQVSLLRLLDWGWYLQMRDPPASSAPAAIFEPRPPWRGRQGSPQPGPDVYLQFARRRAQPLHLTGS